MEPDGLAKQAQCPMETQQGRIGGGRIGRGHIAMSLELVVRADEHCGATTYVISGPGHKYFEGDVITLNCH